MALNLDPALIEAARSNPDSLERLIADAWPEAFRLAAAILRDRALAEDAAQEACASMAAALPSLKAAGSFRTWFYRLVVNEAITISRRRRETATLDDENLLAMETDDALALDISRALQRLPTEQRVMVLLHYYAGLSSREIAIAAHMPAPTVRFRLMLARRALRRALAVGPGPSMEVLSNAH